MKKLKTNTWICGEGNILVLDSTIQGESIFWFQTNKICLSFAEVGTQIIHQALIKECAP